MKQTLEHIKGIEEKKFIKTLMEYSVRAEKQNRPLFTKFYNKEWMQSLIKQYFVPNAFLHYEFFGGYESAERQILAISPYALEDSDFLVGVIQIEVKTGIGKALGHRDYLGALMGLGVERDTIGDIILHETGAYIFIEMSMIPYIRSQLNSIGRYQKVQVDEVELSQVQIQKPRTKMIETTVQSLRMDAICASAFGLSRTECAKLIQGDKARCNGLVVSVNQTVKEGDVLTLRGYGKANLKSVNGQTKKDRTHITIEKYI